MPCKAEASRITQTGLPYNTDTDLLSQAPVRRAFSHGYFLSPKSFLPPTRYEAGNGHFRGSESFGDSEIGGQKMLQERENTHDKKLSELGLGLVGLWGQGNCLSTVEQLHQLSESQR